MARKPQQDRLDGIYRTIEENLGEKAGFLACFLGVNRCNDQPWRLLKMIEFIFLLFLAFIFRKMRIPKRRFRKYAILSIFTNRR
jgi:hypothetical protein